MPSMLTPELLKDLRAKAAPRPHSILSHEVPVLSVTLLALLDRIERLETLLKTRTETLLQEYEALERGERP